MNNLTIFSPYGDLPESDIHTTTVAVGKRDWAFLQGVYGGRGATQAVLYNLMSRFVQQLKNHGITDYDPDALKRSIEGAIITIPGAIAKPVLNPGGLPGSTEPHNRPETVDRNDGHGIVRVEQPSTGRHDELPVAPSVHAGPKREKRTTAKRQKRTTGGLE